MEPPPAKTGPFVGQNKGRVVTKRELPPRPSAHKGVAKRKLGTHKRAKKKHEEMLNLLRRKRYEMLSGTYWW